MTGAHTVGARTVGAHSVGAHSVETHTIEVEGARVTLDLGVGHIADLAFEVRDGGAGRRTLRPLHRAPWVGERADEGADLAPDLPPDLAPVERRLSGDFLCAPFGPPGDADTPPHGYPANSSWTLVDERSEGGVASATFRLDREVRGARVEKELRLVEGHPALYQTHRLTGGSGTITAAHHPMVRMEAGGRLDVSPKRFALTPHVRHWPEPKARLAYPGRAGALDGFPGAQGGTVDLADYAPGERGEDFAVLVEAPGSALGWSVVTRHAEGDLVVILKDPSVLPVTMLWRSNGGRDAAPWSGRHLGVWGIEDGRSDALTGTAPGDPLPEAGVPTGFDLAPGRTHTIGHVIAALPRPAGWSGAREAAPGDGGLRLSGDGAGALVPLDPGFPLAPRKAARGSHPAA